MILDTSYFRGEINIPGSDREEIGKLLQMFISKYEPEFLNAVLGRTLAKTFTTALTADPILEKWTNLLQGAEFEYPSGVPRKWDGLVASVATPVTTLGELNKRTDLYKRSIIANYVYYEFMRNNSSQTATIGEVSSKAENSVKESPIRKMCAAWNEMSYQVQQLWDFLRASEEEGVYEDWDANQVYFRQFNAINEFNI